MATPQQKPRVLVLGMGISGMAAARLLAEHGQPVDLFDSAGVDQLARALDEAERMGARVFLNREPECAGLAEAVISPGFPPTAFPMPLLRGRNVPVISEIELANRYTHGPIVGITGTNGKSTVTTLVDHFLHACGIAAQAAGNLGTPWTDLVGRRGSESFVSVLELSSFQLEASPTFRAPTAALLNIAPDHLDRYADIEEYVAAKWNIGRNQTAEDLLVVPPELWDEAGRHTPAERQCVAVEDHGKPGAFIEEGRVALRGASGDVTHLESATLAHKFPFQAVNGLFALLLAGRAGADVRKALESWESFTELSHRMEFVRELRGVAYFNDSKATNVHAARCALENLGGPILWLAGGSDKHESFEPLAESMGPVRLAILFGQTREKIAAAVTGKTEVRLVDDLEEAVQLAASLARPGGKVVLSPACASFDQWKNFAARGNGFKKLVGDLS